MGSVKHAIAALVIKRGCAGDRENCDGEGVRMSDLDAVATDADVNANLSLLQAMVALHKIGGCGLAPAVVADGLTAIDDALADRTPEQRAYVAIVYVMAKLGVRFSSVN